MSVSYRVGAGWADVVWTIHGWRLVNSLPGAVECGWGDAWASYPVPTDHLRYLRGASNPAGEVAAIGVGADDHAYLVTSAGVHDVGVAAGQNAVGVYWSIDNWVPVLQRTNTVYSVGDVVRKFPFPEGSSQGFRDVKPDGTIVFGDDAHVVTLAGVTLHKPCTRGAVTVGQIDGSDRIDGVIAGLHFSAIDGPAFEPHVAQGDGEQYAICARTGAGAASILVPPYPAVPVQPPTQPPDPPIPPTEPPMFRYDLSPLDAYAQPRWNALPHVTREEQATTLLQILYEFRAKNHPEIEVYRKAGGTGIIGSDGYLYAEDILVIVQSDGKWWSDVGVAFGAPSAHLVFNGNSFLLTNEPQNCYPPPAPAGVPEQPPTTPPTKPPLDQDLPDRMAALEQQVDALEDLSKVQGMHLQEQAAAIMLLAGRVTRLEDTRPGSGTFHPSDWKAVTSWFGRKYVGVIKGIDEPNT